MNDAAPDRGTSPRPPLLLRLLQWKFVIPLLVVMVVVLSPFAYRAYVLSGLPDIGDPFDVEEFGTVELADADNARFDYEAALALKIPLRSTSVNLSDELDTAMQDDWYSATPVIRNWLKVNRSALDRWKLATEKPDFLYHQPKDVNFLTVLQLMQEFRDFARLALLESSRLLAEGNPDEAWLWCRAVLRSSRHSGQHGTAIERLVGASLHTMGVETLQRISQHPNADERLHQQMLQEVQEIYTMTVKNSVMLKCEYIALRNSILDENVLKDLLQHDPYKSVEGAQYRLHRVCGIEPRLSQLVSQQYIANLLEQIDLPLKEREPRTGGIGLFARNPKKSYWSDRLDPAEVEQFHKKSILARQLFSGLRHVDVACLREETKQRAIELCLASRIYRLRNGTYPDDLEQLVQAKIIDEVPDDPFSPIGLNMHYRRDGEVISIWGIGDNGIDDGGYEIDSENGSRQQLDIGLTLGKQPKNDSVEAKKP
ncbi:MAG: hypothetical protein ACKVT0_21130 [Planctomycetaceae bacterium]